MTQTKIESLLEALLNTAVGFITSLLTWRVVSYLLGMEHSWTQNLLITGIFTVVSIARSYLVRRWCHGRSLTDTLRGVLTP